MTRKIVTTSLFAALLAGSALAQQKPPAPVTASKNGPGPKSKGEMEAVNAVIQSQAKAPDETIAAVDALVGKYADTVYKAFALELEAEAYQKKGDNAKAIVYAEQALQADPKNFDADNLIANILAGTTRENDLDKDEKLNRAEKYAKDSLDSLENGGKPALFANLPDDQWGKQKTGAEAMAYQALGTVAMTRKKNDDAVTNYTKAVELNPDPVTMIRLGRAQMAAKKNTEAVATFDKVIASDAPEQFKNIAKSDRQRAGGK